MLVPLAEVWDFARGMPELRRGAARARTAAYAHEPVRPLLDAGGGVGPDDPSAYIAIRSGESLHRRTFDVLVLGGGIAGLTAAIAAARRWRVGLLTKSTFDDTTTFLAQGGIAAALGPSDSPELHFQDTVNAGAGLCDEEAVRVLVNEGPDRVRELMEICPRFDKVDGEIVLGREGAHSVARVVHAGGDATGSEVSSALAEAARVGSRVQLYENEFVIDLLTVDGRCVGALSLNLDDGGLTLNVAMVTILATGGAGQVYGRTTNPLVATGDGVAMAYRAGAAIRDLEFVQFHPTGLAVAGPGDGAAHHRGAARRGRLPAQRRRRALHDRATTREAELAARDVVVRAMVDEMRAEGSDHVFLDATHLDAALARRSASRRVTAGLAAARPRPGDATSSPWRRSATTSSAAWSPTCGAARRCPACTPAARSPAPACTAPTGWPATRSSRASSSATAWCATSTATSAGSARTCGACASTCRRRAGGAAEQRRRRRAPPPHRPDVRTRSACVRRGDELRRRPRGAAAP